MTMKRSILALLAFAASLAVAAPSLWTETFPATVKPATAFMRVNAGAPIPCQIVPVESGQRSVCDLASITVPGTYSIQVFVTAPAECALATCEQSMSATIDPAFTYRWSAASLAKPSLSTQP